MKNLHGSRMTFVECVHAVGGLSTLWMIIIGLYRVARRGGGVRPGGIWGKRSLARRKYENGELWCVGMRLSKACCRTLTVIR